MEELMKTTKMLCLLILLAIVLSVSFFTGTAHAELKFLGEICFSMQDQGDVTTRVLRLGVSSFGTDYFSLNGKVIEGTDIFIPVHGTVVIENGRGTIEMTLTASGISGLSISGLIFTAIYAFSLDMITLSGSYQAIEHSISIITVAPGIQPTPSVIFGSIAMQPCP